MNAKLKNVRRTRFAQLLLCGFLIASLFCGIYAYQQKHLLKTDQIETDHLFTYSNSEFGFSVKYPKDLDLTAKQVDIHENYLQYNAKCSNGTYNGCGGGAWPDYKISFYRPNGKIAFDVRIFKGDLTNVYGGVRHDDFTFLVSTFHYFGEDGVLDPVDDKTLKNIESSVSFFKQK